MTFEEIYNSALAAARTVDLSKLAGEHMVATLHLTGEGGGVICAELRDGKVLVAPRDDERSEVRVTSDTQTIDQLLKGNLNPMNAYLSGRIKVNGDISKVMRLAQLFQK